MEGIASDAQVHPDTCALRRAFLAENASISIQVRGRQIPTWTIEHNAGPLPEAPITSELPAEDLTLIPYGYTNLRLTEFPVLDDDEKSGRYADGRSRE